MYLGGLCPLDNFAKFYRIFNNGYYLPTATALRAFERIYFVHFLK